MNELVYVKTTYLLTGYIVKEPNISEYERLELTVLSLRSAHNKP